MTSCPQRSVPTPKNRHHSHCSKDKLLVEKAILPYWMISTCKKASVKPSPPKKLGCTTHLCEASSYPDGIENGISEYPFEYVPLSVNLPCVEFIEQSHHDEGVKDNREVLGWSFTDVLPSSRLDIKKLVTYAKKINKGYLSFPSQPPAYSPTKSNANITANW